MCNQAMTWKHSGVARWRYNPREVRGGGDRQTDGAFPLLPPPSPLRLAVSHTPQAQVTSHSQALTLHVYCVVSISPSSVFLLLPLFLLVLFLLYFDDLDLLLSFHLPFFVSISLSSFSYCLYSWFSLLYIDILVYYCHFLFFLFSLVAVLSVYHLSFISHCLHYSSFSCYRLFYLLLSVSLPFFPPHCLVSIVYLPFFIVFTTSRSLVIY